MEDSQPTNEPTAAPFDVEAAIAKVCALPPDEVARSAKISGISLDDLKQIAVHLNLKKTDSKSNLITSIRTKVETKKKLAEIIEKEEGTFRKDKNTFFRLCNILMSFPDALQRSNLLATRTQLQNKEVNEKQPIFNDAVVLFNDSTHNSGGLVAEHEEFTSRRIDPEAVNNSGKITAAAAFRYFKDVRTSYAKAIVKYEQSGRHNKHDFFTYTQYDVDVLYLFMWLEKLNNPELTAYCAEGCELPGGLDTGHTVSSHCFDNPTAR